MIYSNKEIVRTFTRNNLPAGYVGGSIDYRVPANVYFGDTQEEADSKAEDDINANGQDYANTYADIIPSVWYNDQVCDEFIKNNCVSGKGSKEQVCVEKGRFVSYVSKKDANDKARVELGRIGQGRPTPSGLAARTGPHSLFVAYFIRMIARLAYQARKALYMSYHPELSYLIYLRLMPIR